VWFWGGGNYAAVKGRHFHAVWSDDALASALAAAGDAHSARLPRNAREWRKQAARVEGTRDAHLIVLTELASAVSHRDSDAWRSRVAALEDNWIAPLLALLRQRDVERLIIVAPGGSACWRFEMTRTDLMKFWRRRQPWSSYA
jgi:hypothetical protein